MRPHIFSKLLWLSVCLLIYVFSCSSAGAQLVRHTLTIDGIVHDTNEQPIEGIEVQLLTDSGNLVGTVYTKPTGKFEFGSLQGGEYLVLIDVAGYEPIRENVNLPGSSRSGVTLTLRRTPGTTPVVTSAEQTVTARELALPRDAQEALRKGRERLYEKHDPAGSLRYFAKVLKLSPDFYEADYYTGMAHLFQNQFGGAESSFRAAIAASHDQYGEAFVGLATVLSSTNQFAEAETSARMGLRLQPDSWQGYLELARAQLGMNRAVEAEKSAIEARQLKPDFADLYITLVNIHIRMKNDAALLQDVDAYLKLAPNGQYSSQIRHIREQITSSKPSGEL